MTSHIAGCRGGAAVRRWTRDRMAKSTRSTQPSILPG